MSSRRTFLRNLLVLSASASLLSGRAAAAFSTLLQPEGAASVAELTAANFSRCRGATFTLRAADGRAQSVVLADVQAYDRGPALENFSLHFNGGAASELPQGIHQFAHPEIGRFELFVVARRNGNSVVSYEAVINRLVA
jgi:hypothetical protein